MTSTSPFRNINIMKASTFNGISSFNPEELYIVAEDPDYKPSTLYQKMTNSSSSILLLDDSTTIYKVAKNTIPSTFDVSRLSSKSDVITFELYIASGGTYSAPTWPSNLIWVDEEPDVSVTTENNLLAFRSFDGGSTWIGNLQCSW